MKIARLDRMLWLPIRLVDDKKIKDETTLVTKSDYAGRPKKLTLWETKNLDEETWIRVPRRWGMQQKWLTQGFRIIDETVSLSRGWPEIQIDSYWKGQEESINSIVRHYTGSVSGGALLEAPCGSGKTLMGSAIAAKLHAPTLVIVHKEDLAWQWHKTIKNCFRTAKLGHVQGDKWMFENRHLVTATAQTLYRRMDRLPAKFLDSFGMVIYDEGHRYPAQTFERVLRMFPSAYRLGVSATWRRKDGMECIWDWHVGRVEWRTAATRLTGSFAQIPWSTRLYDNMFKTYGRINHTSWVSAISENDAYNAWLAEELSKGAEAGRKLLLVSDRIDQLRNLQQRIIRKGGAVTVGLYVGAIDNKRLTTEELDTAKTCDIILASYGMMAEGTDIPSLDTLFIGTPRTDVEQVVGRIQRHKDGKKNLLIVDPIFQTPYCIALARKRRLTYESLDFKEHTNGKESCSKDS